MTNTAAPLPTWAITLKTGRYTWSTLEVPAEDHIAAVRAARRLLGNHPVTSII
jgi:hypothetical protein